MRRISIYIIFSLLIQPYLFGQETKETPLDTIFLMSTRRIFVKVLNLGAIEVDYMTIHDSQVHSLNRKEIEKIHFSDGRKEKFNDPPVIIVTDWRVVTTTENKEDVEGFIIRGEISAKGSQSNSKAKAKANTILLLRKKAANLGGIIVLIIDTQLYSGYGEPPGYLMKGIVYGTEPLPDEDENVIDNKDPGKIER